MKLIIDIDENLYKRVISPEHLICFTDPMRCEQAIKNGTPLPKPKGHGRLIDADKFISEHFGKVARLVDDAPTIIEADKGDNE